MPGFDLIFIPAQNPKIFGYITKEKNQNGWQPNGLSHIYLIPMNLNFTTGFKTKTTENAGSEHQNIVSGCFRNTLKYIQCFNMILNMANSSSRIKPFVIHIRSVLAPGIPSCLLISSRFHEMSPYPQLIQNLQRAQLPFHYELMHNTLQIIWTSSNMTSLYLW